MPQFDHLATAPAVDVQTSPESDVSNNLLSDIVDQTPPRDRTAHGIAIGSLTGFDADGIPLVDIAAFSRTGVRARSTTALDATQVGRQVALGFEAGDPGRPIILGLMLAVAPVPPTRHETNVVVDGEKVVLTADHEIELRCGDAAIVLSADGRIQIRGTYITSHASATQRILGGSVNLN